MWKILFFISISILLVVSQDSLPISKLKYVPLYGPKCGVVDSISPRIVGGEPAKLGAWPWLVAIGYEDEINPIWGCGGAIISIRHVLTAGHCVREQENRLKIVRIGDLDLNNTIKDGAIPITCRIEKAYVHPQYQPANFTNDVAVLRLDRDIKFTKLIKPICLPIPQDVFRANFVGTTPFIAGWGTEAFAGLQPTYLQNVQIPVLEASLCKSIYATLGSSIIEDRIICAGYLSGGKDACTGDSGGPLMTNRNGIFYVIGIISIGDACATPGVPGIYTKTTAYLNWIISKLN